MTECELIMIEVLRELELHPSHALAALNNAFYNQGINMHAVNMLAEAIGRMEEIEEEDEEF